MTHKIKTALLENTANLLQFSEDHFYLVAGASVILALIGVVITA